jgi:hypothetical protein
LVDWIDLARWEPKVFDVIAAAAMSRYKKASRARMLPTLLAAQKRMRSKK